MIPEIERLMQQLETAGGDADKWRTLQAKVSALCRQYEAAQGIVGAYLALGTTEDQVSRSEVDAAAVAFLNVVL